VTSPLEQKLKITGPVVVTANRVVDGAVVYRGADGAWTTEFDSAAVTTSAAAAREWLAAAADDQIRAIDAYVAPVTMTADGRVRPGNLRELIRCSGPTTAIRRSSSKSEREHVRL
jgi:hypothetical protein